MLDRDGYRPNVGIILVNARNEVFWGKRIREHSWQFPQGGIKRGETPEQAMFRELQEEVGLMPEHVRIIARTREWRGHYRGQKQIWFLLRLIGRDSDVSLRACEHPEFDAWRWHDFWIPLETVIEFKRAVYQQALTELSRHLFCRPEPSRYLRQHARQRPTRGGRSPREADGPGESGDAAAQRAPDAAGPHDPHGERAPPHGPGTDEAADPGPTDR